jgi:hypothetical protein
LRTPESFFHHVAREVAIAKVDPDDALSYPTMEVDIGGRIKVKNQGSHFVFDVSGFSAHRRPHLGLTESMGVYRQFSLDCYGSPGEKLEQAKIADDLNRLLRGEGDPFAAWAAERSNRDALPNSKLKKYEVEDTRISVELRRSFSGPSLYYVILKVNFN